MLTKNNMKYAGRVAVLGLIASLAMPSLSFLGNSTHLKSKTELKQNQKGMAVAYPWVFKNGNETSRTMAVGTVQEIAQKADYASVGGDEAAQGWANANLPRAGYRHMPSMASLEAYGKSMKVRRVLYGSINWNTRSIWVNLGPKTISTATVNVYVFDVAKNKVVYSKRGVQGRSDEKSDGWKIAADVLITPLVTAVSGGPATPREQRAVQIALGKAYHSWVRGN